MPRVKQNVMPQWAQNNFYTGLRNNLETLAEYKKKNDAAIQKLVASIRNMEIHIGKIANALSNKPQGALPNDTEDARQNHNEQWKVVTLCSWKLCEAETSTKQFVQCEENEPIVGTDDIHQCATEK
ncbi:hypothetical protein V6N13_008756 [Hibiscus sabdariffa]